jgi:uncharacterized protein with FMN-binding domain
MYREKPNNTALKATAGIVVILAVVVLTILSEMSESNRQQAIASQPAVVTAPSAPSSTETTPAPNQADTGTSAAATGPKDGTYVVTTQYYVPSGYENVKVTVTIRGEVITDSGVVGSEKDRESRAFQRDFTSGYKSKVVGKKISELKLSTVAGASLTTQAFNDALVDIQKQAKA